MQEEDEDIHFFEVQQHLCIDIFVDYVDKKIKMYTCYFLI